MPIYNLICRECPSYREFVGKESELPEQLCKECKRPMSRAVTSPSQYTIKGNNSASTTPRKFRGSQ